MSIPFAGCAKVRSLVISLTRLNTLFDNARYSRRNMTFNLVGTMCFRKCTVIRQTVEDNLVVQPCANTENIGNLNQRE